MPNYPIAFNVKKPFMSIHGIYPLKQHVIEELIEHVEKNCPHVIKIGVFGSAVDGRCTVYSDLDIIVWTDGIWDF